LEDWALGPVPKIVVWAGIAMAGWLVALGGTALGGHVAIKLGRHAHAMHLAPHWSSLTGIKYPPNH